MKNNAAYSSVAQITRSADSCRSPFRAMMVVVTMLMVGVMSMMINVGLPLIWIEQHWIMMWWWWLWMICDHDSDKILSQADQVPLAVSYHRNVLMAGNSREVISFWDIYHPHDQNISTRKIFYKTKMFCKLKTKFCDKYKMENTV